MAGQINLQPQILNLSLYAGDGVEFRLVCKSGTGAPIDITGVVKAEVRLDRLSSDNAIATFSVNSTDAYQGIIVLSLTGAQTEALSQHSSSKAGKFSGVWDIQWTPAGLQPRTLCQGTVECVADVTQ
jgi:hypothetical protein